MSTLFFVFLLLFMIMLNAGNSMLININIWPFAIEYQMPLFFVIIGAFLLGFIACYIVTYPKIRAIKKQSRKFRNKAGTLDESIRNLK